MPFGTPFREVDVIAVDYQFFSGGGWNPSRSVGFTVPVKHPATVKAPQLLHIGEPVMGAFGLPIVHIRSRLPRSW